MCYAHTWVSKVKRTKSSKKTKQKKMLNTKFSDKSILFMEENGFILDKDAVFFKKHMEINGAKHEINIINDYYDTVVCIENIKNNSDTCTISIVSSLTVKHLGVSLNNQEVLHTVLGFVVRDIVELIEFSELNRHKKFCYIYYSSYEECDFHSSV